MRALLFVLTLLIGLSLPVAGSALTIQAGVADNFTLPGDPASPSIHLVNGLAGTFLDFDVLASDSFVGHTFVGLPTDITSAILEIRLEAAPVGGTENDFVALTFADALGIDVGWLRSIGTTSGVSDGLLPTPWISGSQTTLTLDLAALPLEGGGTLNLIPQLNAAGFVDLLVADETGVDYATLTLEFVSMPEPSTALLMAAGLIGTALMGRPRRR